MKIFYGVQGTGNGHITRARAIAPKLRQAGAEFGATTGRPRRCGWLDIAALRLAVRLNGLAGLALSFLLAKLAALAVRVGAPEA